MVRIPERKMKAYRATVKIKLGLIAAAVLIAVASLFYTHRLAERLRAQEHAIIHLWARAIEHQSRVQTDNPYLPELDRIDGLLAQMRPAAPVLSGETTAVPIDSMRSALAWARGMPPADEIDFVTNEIIIPNQFPIPAILTDARQGVPIAVRNVDVDPSLSDAQRNEYLLRLAARMDEVHEPIAINAYGLEQLVHFGESQLVKHLRIFPYVQLMFVSLFILVGYLGFSYVRRNEQSSLWVGMAKEAAHQLGTPISSMLGWLELLRMDDLPREQYPEIVNELEKDVARLQRVTNRFSDIGSLPKLSIMALAPVVNVTADYMRRRMPSGERHVALQVNVPEEIQVALNAELFEWVIENLLKNALDAIEDPHGTIEISAQQVGQKVTIDVRDTGKGIDRRQWKNVFRPGYSTKKRGWGLGLSLAKRIIEDYHGGQLTLATSRPGHGATFRIVLEAQK
jgi:two-component system, NtrC family, sensor histidine kinase KinB